MKTILFCRLTIGLILTLGLFGGGAIVQAQEPIPTPIPTPTQSADDVLRNLQPRPLPALPDLRRVGVSTDNTLTLSVNDAIRRALENNNTIEFAKDDVRINEQTLRALEGVYDPSISVSPTFFDNTQANSRFFSGVQDSSNVISSRSFTVNSQWDQLIRRGGGSFSGFFNNQRDASNSSLFSTSYAPTLGVQFTQPIWRGRRIDNNRRQIKIQRKRLEQSDADFRRQTIDIISQVQRAYWDLVFALRDQQNRIDNLNLTRENLRRVEAQISAGAAAPLARAEVQVELANRESDLLLATQNVTAAENTVKSLIYKESNGAEWSAQLLPTDRPAQDIVSVNVDDAIKDAIENRPELSRLKLAREITAIDVDYFGDQSKPRIDLTGAFSLNGLAGSPRDAGQGSVTQPLISNNPALIETNANAFLLNQINLLRNNAGLGNATVPDVTTTSAQTNQNLVGGYNQALRNLFKFDTRTVQVGVTIQFPLRNRTARANLAGARIQQEQIGAQTRSQEQVIVVEVRNAVQAVDTARLRVQATRVARENAEIQLAGEQKLYQVGRSTTFLLIQRENALANARNNELRAETDYNKALADLQRATSTTLRINNVTIESPMDEK